MKDLDLKQFTNGAIQAILPGSVPMQFKVIKLQAHSERGRYYYDLAVMYRETRSCLDGKFGKWKNLGSVNWKHFKVKADAVDVGGKVAYELENGTWLFLLRPDQLEHEESTACRDKIRVR